MLQQKGYASVQDTYNFPKVYSSVKTLVLNRHCFLGGGGGGGGGGEGGGQIGSDRFSPLSKNPVWNPGYCITIAKWGLFVQQTNSHCYPDVHGHQDGQNCRTAHLVLSHPLRCTVHGPSHMSTIHNEYPALAPCTMPPLYNPSSNSPTMQ